MKMYILYRSLLSGFINNEAGVHGKQAGQNEAGPYEQQKICHCQQTGDAVNRAA